MGRKRCPPGVFCIENVTLYVICVVLIASLWFLYFYKNSPVKQSIDLNSNYNNSMFSNLYSHHHNNLPPHIHNRHEHPMFNMSSQAIIPESGYNTLRPIAKPGISYNEDPKDTLMNPYSPPLQTNQPHTYRQIGYLKNQNYGNKMFPIFAKPQHVRRDKWYYYTIYDNIKLPIYYKNRKCSSTHGCDSLMNGDTVKLENIQDEFIVTTYDNESLVYDPVI